MTNLRPVIGGPASPIINLTIFSTARKGHLSGRVIIYETWINAISCDALDATVLSKFTEADCAARFSGLLRRRKGLRDSNNRLETGSPILEKLLHLYST